MYKMSFELIFTIFESMSVCTKIEQKLCQISDYFETDFGGFVSLSLST